MKDNEQLYACLNLLVGSWFLLECIDNLRGTGYDTQQLKARLNQLEPELRKKIDRDLNLLWGVDDQAMYNLQENFRQFVSGFATKRLEHVAGFGELLAQFHMMPELTLHRLGIKIVDSEKQAV